MRARRHWLSTLMCVLVLALCTRSQAQLFQVTSGRLELEKGNLVAREKGAVVRLSKGITMTLAPGTKLAKVHKRERLWLSAKGRTLTHLLVMESGRVDVECRDPNRAVMVRAPFEVASIVQSGRMGVRARSGQVSLINYEGSVVWAARSWKFMPLGQKKVHTLSRDFEVETALMPAPEVRMENNIYGGFGRGAELSGVDWKPVPEADSYQVEIEQFEPEKRLSTQLRTFAPVLSPPPVLPAGRYGLSVRAVDRFGIEGPASSVESFNVVGVRPSDGGYVDRRGNIVAGYDRRVQLTYADGLVMKGGQLDWQPVPEAFVLPSAEPMSLHVRHADDTRMLSARVIAHQVKAVVSVGPKYVRWPGDSVQIEIGLTGAEGEPAPGWIEPRFRVLLGIDELDVSWTRHLDRFTAEVPAQAGEGPWVVRVEVYDQYGHPLGRDFVEIAPQPAPAPALLPLPAAPPAQASR
jgi:hypothetical protein